jgi:threonine/homoserine/homoserine lactone efflux protein
MTPSIMADLPLFVLAVAAVLATPGPTNALLFTAAGLVGAARSLPLLLAELAGYGLAIGTLRLAGGPLIAASRSFGFALRLLLVGYLLLLAWRLWQAVPEPGGERPRAVTFTGVFVTTLLNPKALVFAFALFPVFDSLQAAASHAAAFALTVLAVGLCWITGGAVLGRMAGARLPRLLPRLAALVLCVIASLIAGAGFSAGH